MNLSKQQKTLLEKSTKMIREARNNFDSLNSQMNVDYNWSGQADIEYILNDLNELLKSEILK